MIRQRWSRTAVFGVVFGVLSVSAQADAQLYTLFRAEELEFAFDNEENPIAWDVTSWVGGDWNRVYLKSEGEALVLSGLGVEAEAQLLYSRLIAPFWEFQVGVRGDFFAEESERDGRGLLVVGLQGMARYWFEMELAVFLSHRGDVSGRLMISHDLFVTQRLIAESSLEVNVAVQEVPEFGVGAGFNDLELGLRLRYEFLREFAPYVGVTWRRSFAGAARFRQAAGLSSSTVSGVAGIRLWF